MSSNYARLFAKYTDEQLLEVATQPDTLVDAARLAFDDEMLRRGFNLQQQSDKVAGVPAPSGRGVRDGVAALFLQAQHWQIFLLLCGAMFAAQAAIMSPSALTAQPRASLWKISPLFAVMWVLATVLFLGWLGSTGSFLSSIVQPSLRPTTGFFRVAVIFPAVYVPAFMAIFPGATPSAFAFIIPFHLFVMFCMFYLLYFVSKSLVLAETGKPAAFYDYAGPLFLLWLFPVGIWIIQPRINRLYAERLPASPY